VQIQAYQGDSSDPENNERLGDVRLTGIPAAKLGKEPVEVTFAYDMNGILQVKASVVSTGEKVSAEISTTGVKPKPVVDISKWEGAENARHYRPVIRKAEKQIASGNDETGELALLVMQIKEAVMLKNNEQAESLREELLDIMEELV
jgi:molecular chaperone DnaK